MNKEEHTIHALFTATVEVSALVKEADYEPGQEVVDAIREASDVLQSMIAIFTAKDSLKELV